MKYRMQEDGSGWMLTRIDDQGNEMKIASYDDFDSCLADCREVQGFEKLPDSAVEEPAASDAPPEAPPATGGPGTEPQEPSSDDPPPEVA